MNIPVCSFGGICQVYKVKNYEVIPISYDPSIKDIEDAIETAKSEDAHSGLNGRTFFLGEDLVVKKYLPKDKAANYNPDREIKALDLFFEKNCNFNNVQQGKYAFKVKPSDINAQNEDTYLVSTRVQGNNPDYNSGNRFNSSNIQSLVQTISELDMPKRKKGERFPYEVPMHYDLTPGNVVISKNNGGIIDFEYLQFDDLNERLSKALQGGTDAYTDFSDIAGISSNLRTFEYRTLYGYLMNMPSNEANELFKSYLEAKSNYHQNRADFYEKEAQRAEKAENEELKELLSDLKDKESSHSEVLSSEQIDENIIKAEAMKIQIANFIYTQGGYCNTKGVKVNIKQINTYINETEKFFEKRLKHSNTREKRIYYRDCIELLNNWKKVSGWMEWQKECLDDIRYAEKIGAKDYIEKNKDKKHYADIFEQKLTTEEQETLDKHIFK